ncbi:MAG TPA: hypothetical protein PKJ17_02390 [Syntrophorhabdaceae bacterium]|nr:hypothetical protein [Syntrophorhabdaceae bacterium]
MLRVFLIVLFFLIIGTTALCAGAEPKVEVFPPASYDRHIIYQALIFFWIGIIGLIVIIAMKLREIKRVQKMGIDEEEGNVPFLD